MSSFVKFGQTFSNYFAYKKENVRNDIITKHYWTLIYGVCSLVTVYTFLLINVFLFLLSCYYCQYAVWDTDPLCRPTVSVFYFTNYAKYTITFSYLFLFFFFRFHSRYQRRCKHRQSRSLLPGIIIIIIIIIIIYLLIKHTDKIKCNQ